MMPIWSLWDAPATASAYKSIFICKFTFKCSNAHRLPHDHLTSLHLHRQSTHIATCFSSIPFTFLIKFSSSFVLTRIFFSFPSKLVYWCTHAHARTHGDEQQMRPMAIAAAAAVFYYCFCLCLPHRRLLLHDVKLLLIIQTSSSSFIQVQIKRPKSTFGLWRRRVSECRRTAAAAAVTSDSGDDDEDSLLFIISVH